MSLNSMRARLLLSLLALLAAAALVMGASSYRSVLAETEALFDYQLRQMALALRDQGEIAPSQAHTLSDEQLDFVVQIWTADGRSIYASREHANLPARALLGLAEINVAGQRWRTFSVATPGRVIQVAQPVQIRQKLAAAAALRSVQPLLWLAPLLALLGWWLSAMTVAPLRAVATEVSQRDAQALTALPTAGLPDEVAPLVGALNALLQRLGATLDQQRAFVADAAHELRSPLTALKLQAQLLQRAPDEAGRAAAMAALTAGIERAARLVEQLLALARAEPGGPALVLQTLDLSELVRGVMADSLSFALARGSELSLQAEAAIQVQAEPAALAMLVRNLLDNALRHGKAGGHVELSVSEIAGRPTLWVDDDGPGIPAEDRERVFDRFYRRNPGGDGQSTVGSGLGLAIARNLAEQLGASINLGDSPLGGLRVSLTFA
ncbi:sensor histidine kinase N-terminal domain-containing protein [Paucibacter sp. B2R-40]|uniref:ATP-binding protein n=1 Tax=Paucibacter sp. B2R-40 TaxID=2893554 RepID=UPI0021E3C5E7|nr:ATP-binding protein [Paucibacter sp. B2R-40]MCV2356767.1 sensor histidine kinase N-terminal domain-containing protein [Paucibacter sp. B2R-40]